MSIYFEKKLSTSFGDVCTDVSWYNDKTLAAACLSQSDGSYINIFDTQGNVVKKLNSPKDCGPVTSMAWHARGSICVAWGALFCVCMEEDNEITVVESPHRAPIRLLLFSQHGGRLISADSEGGLVGWNSAGRQLLTIFHHQLSDVITHAIFVNQPDRGLDLWGVARAAVAGDERALDMFTNMDMFGWRPKTAGRRAMAYPTEVREGLCLYAAAASGILLYINDTGRCEEVLDIGCTCQDILYRPDKDQLLVLTESLAIIHLSVAADGAVDEIMKVKLSGDTREVIPTMAWARSDTVAVNLGGTSIRLWNLDTGENLVLQLPESAPSAEHFTALSSGLANGIFCGGTNGGNLLLWRKAEEEWESAGNTSVSTPVKQVAWGGELLAVNTLSSLYLLRQHPLSASFSHQMGCIQVTGSNVMLYLDNGAEPLKYELSAEIQVHGLAVSPKYCLLFSDKSVVCYHYNFDNKGEVSVQSVGSFQCQCQAANIYEESLIILEEKRVTMRTIQGTVKQILFFVPTEGDPIVLSTFKHFVSVVTTEGVLRLWDISRREAKSHGRLKNLRDIIEDFGEAMAACCNSDGTKVALTVADPNLMPVNRLYILDVETDRLQWLDFSSGSSNDEDAETQDIANKMIVSFSWDEEDPKLVVVHAKPIQTETAKENVIVCLWVSAENGILVHEKLAMRSYHTRLLSCSAPYVTVLAPQTAERVDHITLGDFAGVSDLTPTTLRAILSFSYNLAVGNMDLAFKAINSVTSESVWMNLAKNCVKTKRLDVALVCMGRMKNARVAHALRKAESEPELDARVGILALHVGMLEEAKALFKGCGRFDLLNKLHQSLSQWDEALNVAEEMDRVHLRNTYHLHGKFLEQSGQLDAALENFEKADTHRIHGPRLLVDDPERLKAYVDKSGDPHMLKWLAQYLESTGDMQEALQYYTLAKDFCSIVRVLCFLNNFSQASEIVVNSGDRAAAYHLARQFEALEKIDEALIFFTKAGAFGNAIRICKEQGLTEKVWSLALQGTARDQSEAAQFLLEAGDHHKAILLYQRAGMTHKALEHAFSCGDYDALDIISHGMSTDMDPSMLEKLAEFFITNQQYSRAVDMLAAAGKFSESVALCTEHNVQLTDELADKLNPTGPNRNKLLQEIANCALGQGNYHLATKKFTQAGDKVSAMKALLKSGDTDKIIFLASVSREKDVYVMAANYLQALDWRSNPQLLNTVIQFYTKAKAHQALANFYTACANVEVEEYDDLDKALVALGEAKRCLSRVTADDRTSRRVAETVERRLADVQQFIRARRAFEADDHENATAVCRQLLGTTDPDGPIPRGRILALMIMNGKDKQNTRQLFEELRSVVSDPTKLIPPQVLASLGLLTTTVPFEQDSEIEFQTSF